MINTNVARPKKDTRTEFFVFIFLYHSHYASFTSPLTVNVSDMFYVRHSDKEYLFNMMNNLGVIESLSMVKKRQTWTF